MKESVCGCVMEDCGGPEEGEEVGFGGLDGKEGAEGEGRVGRELVVGVEAGGVEGHCGGE